MIYDKMENIEYDALLEKFKKVLKQNGLKYTKQREILLKILYNADEHYSPDELHSALKKVDPDTNIGIATIYRTLNLLEEAGMATSISFGAAGKRFELATKPHHDHMICKVCASIIEFEDAIIEKRQLAIAKTHGFTLSGHLMQLYGVCKNCSGRKRGE